MRELERVGESQMFSEGTSREFANLPLSVTRLGVFCAVGIDAAELQFPPPATPNFLASALSGKSVQRDINVVLKT